MYVHAGNNCLIRTREILGIFDMDTATIALPTREYLKKIERSGKMINIKEEIPKSFIVTVNDNSEDKVYVSQISTQAIVGRINSGIKE